MLNSIKSLSIVLFVPVVLMLSFNAISVKLPNSSRTPAVELSAPTLTDNIETYLVASSRIK